MHSYETLFACTPDLDVEVSMLGPRDGPAVMLLHGWPDAPRTWAEVAPGLAAEGYRVVIPALRGFGGTRLRGGFTARTGQLASLGQDAVELADALEIDTFAVVGHDWGARAAYIATCLWPQRVSACVALSVGWGTNSAAQKLSMRQVQNYWYQWYMATPRGAELVKHARLELTRHLWDTWCPYWKIDEDEFVRTAAAFENPDWAEVVLHSYRHRWGWAPADPDYAGLEARLSAPPLITRPTLVLHGAQDPCNDPATSENKESLFGGAYLRLLIERCGHFPQREHPQQVTRHILDWLQTHAS